VKFTFTQREAVFQAIGQASMCWSPAPEGLFKSQDAGRVGEGLIVWLENSITASMGAAQVPHETKTERMLREQGLTQAPDLPPYAPKSET
jgi:hypothetical protein